MLGSAGVQLVVYQIGVMSRSTRGTVRVAATVPSSPTVE
jgi:hypothetical protein